MTVGVLPPAGWVRGCPAVRGIVTFRRSAFGELTCMNIVDRCIRQSVHNDPPSRAGAAERPICLALALMVGNLYRVCGVANPICRAGLPPEVGVCCLPRGLPLGG